MYIFVKIVPTILKKQYASTRIINVFNVIHRNSVYFIVQNAELHFVSQMQNLLILYYVVTQLPLSFEWLRRIVGKVLNYQLTPNVNAANKQFITGDNRYLS